MEIKDIIISRTVGNLYWKDTEGKYLGCNNAFSEMIGLSSPQEIVGKTDWDLFLNSLGEDKLRLIIAHDQEVIREGREKTIEEIGVNQKKEIAYYITRKAPLIDEQGKVIGLMGTSIDVTKEKQAVLAKQRFLENMSHDIRTPLSGIYGISKFLHDHYDEEEFNDQAIKEILGDITQSAEILLNFANNILEGINFSNNPIKKEHLHIKDVIGEVIHLLLPEIRCKQLNYQINSADICIKTDKFRLFRILLNLISNAVKFTHVGGIKINAYLAGNLFIEIEDTGIGISEDKLGQIFEEFYKVAPSNQSAVFMGFGMGLHLVRKMSEEIGGEVTVESILNKGSKFTLMLKQEN